MTNKYLAFEQKDHDKFGDGKMGRLLIWRLDKITIALMRYMPKGRLNSDFSCRDLL
jgi:hypothetical protein